MNWMQDKHNYEQAKKGKKESSTNSILEPSYSWTRNSEVMNKANIYCIIKQTYG